MVSIFDFFYTEIGFWVISAIFLTMLPVIIWFGRGKGYRNITSVSLVFTGIYLFCIQLIFGIFPVQDYLDQLITLIIIGTLIGIGLGINNRIREKDWTFNRSFSYFMLGFFSVFFIQLFHSVLYYLTGSTFLTDSINQESILILQIYGLSADRVTFLSNFYKIAFFLIDILPMLIIAIGMIILLIFTSNGKGKPEFGVYLFAISFFFIFLAFDFYFTRIVITSI